MSKPNKPSKALANDPHFKRIGVSLSRDARKRLKKLRKKHGVDKHMLISALIMAANVD